MKTIVIHYFVYLFFIGPCALIFFHRKRDKLTAEDRNKDRWEYRRVWVQTDKESWVDFAGVNARGLMKMGQSEIYTKHILLEAKATSQFYKVIACP